MSASICKQSKCHVKYQGRDFWTSFVFKAHFVWIFYLFIIVCPHYRGYAAFFTIRSLHLDSLAGCEPKEIRGEKCTVCARVCVFESTLYVEPNSAAVPIFLSVLTKEIDCLYVIFSSQSSFASSVSLYFFSLHHTCITGTEASAALSPWLGPIPQGYLNTNGTKGMFCHSFLVH